MPRYCVDNSAGLDGPMSSVHLGPFLPLKGVKDYESGVWPLRIYTDHLLSMNVEHVPSAYLSLGNKMARAAAASNAWVRRVNGSSHMVVPNAGTVPHEVELAPGVTGELFMAKLQYTRAEGSSLGEEVLVFPTQGRVLFLFEYAKHPPHYREMDSHPLKQRVADVTRKLKFNLTVASRRVIDSPGLPEGMEAT